MTVDLDRVTSIVCELGKLPGVGPDQDFYDAGFSSINALELLIELEAACEVSIPDDDFIQARTVRSLGAMIDRLKQEQVV